MQTSSINSSLVSVIIPTFNRANTIERSIESVLAQTHPMLELLVVDDGSTDRTEQVIQKFQSRCEFLKYVKFNTNIGSQGARIEGIKQARGEYVVFLDSDDELLQDSVEMRLRALKESKFSAALVYGDVISQSGEIRHLVEFKRLHGYSYNYLTRELCLCPHSAMLVSKHCFENRSFPSPTFPSWTDDDMVLTVGKGFPVLHCGGVVALMHRSEISITTDPLKLAKGCSMIVRKYWPDILDHHGPFRLFLWGLRIVRLYISVSAYNEEETTIFSRVARRIKLFALKILDRILRPFFYKMFS